MRKHNIHVIRVSMYTAVIQNHVKDRSITLLRIHHGAPSEDRTHDPWFTRATLGANPLRTTAEWTASSDVMITPIAL